MPGMSPKQEAMLQGKRGNTPPLCKDTSQSWQAAIRPAGPSPLHDEVQLVLMAAQ